MQEYESLTNNDDKKDWILEYKTKCDNRGNWQYEFTFGRTQYHGAFEKLSECMRDFVREHLNVKKSRLEHPWNTRRNAFNKIDQKELPIRASTADSISQFVLNFESLIECYKLDSDGIVELVLDTIRSLSHVTDIEPKLLNAEDLVKSAEKASRTSTVAETDLADIREKLAKMGWKKYIEASLKDGKIAYSELLKYMDPDTGSRVVEIVGRGGLGKTALMYHFVRQNTHENYLNSEVSIPLFEKYVILSGKTSEQGEPEILPENVKDGFVTSSKTDDSKFGPRIHLRELKFHDFIEHVLAEYSEKAENMEEKIDLARQILNRNRWLIVLDNFEDVSTEDAVKYHSFISSLDTNPKSRIVITGREDLKSGFPTLELDVLTPRAAQSLMYERYEYNNHEYGPDAYGVKEDSQFLSYTDHLRSLRNRHDSEGGKDIFTQLRDDENITKNAFDLALHPCVVIFLTNLLGSKEMVQKHRKTSPSLEKYLSSILENEAGEIKAFADGLFDWVTAKAFRRIETDPVCLRILSILGKGQHSRDEIAEKLEDVDGREFRQALDKLLMADIFLSGSKSSGLRLNETTIPYLIKHGHLDVELNEVDESDEENELRREKEQNHYYTFTLRMQKYEENLLDIPKFDDNLLVTTLIQIDKLSQELHSRQKVEIQTYRSFVAIISNLYERSQGRDEYKHDLADETYGWMNSFRNTMLWFSSQLFSTGSEFLINESKELLEGEPSELFEIVFKSWKMMVEDKPFTAQNHLNQFVKIFQSGHIQPVLDEFQSANLARWLLEFDLSDMDEESTRNWLRMLSITRSSSKKPDLRSLASCWPFIRPLVSTMSNEFSEKSELAQIRWFHEMKNDLVTLSTGDDEWNSSTAILLHNFETVVPKLWPNVITEFDSWNRYDRPKNPLPDDLGVEFEIEGANEWVSGDNGLSFVRYKRNEGIPVFTVVDFYNTTQIVQGEPTENLTQNFDDSELSEFVAGAIKDILNKRGTFSADLVQIAIHDHFKERPNIIIQKFTGNEFQSWHPWLKWKINDSQSPEFEDFEWKASENRPHESTGNIHLRGIKLSRTRLGSKVTNVELSRGWKIHQLPRSAQFASKVIALMVHTVSQIRPEFWNTAFESNWNIPAQSKQKALTDLLAPYYGEDPNWEGAKSLFWIIGYNHAKHRHPNFKLNHVRFSITQWIDSKKYLYDENDLRSLADWLNYIESTVPKILKRLEDRRSNA